MDMSDFKANVADVTAFLKGLRTIIPARLDEKVIAFLEAVQNDPIGLEVLRNAIASQNPKAS